jgi:hypothetical protein
VNLSQGFPVAQAQEVDKPLDFQQTNALAPTLQLLIAAPGWM